MANPMWVAGAPSANPAGRPKRKNTATTIKGKIESFLRGAITPRILKRIFNELSARDQFQMLIELMPYFAAKHSPEAITDEKIDELYSRLEQTMRQHGKAI